MVKRIVFSLLLLLATLTVSSAAEPIRIGLTLGLAGKYAEMSDMEMKGFRVWEKEVNNRGGILQRKVEVIIYDDKSDPQIARSLYEHLIEKDRVDFVFGPYSSEITEAILPLTERYRYPTLLPGAAADRLWQKGYRYAFGIFTPASQYASGFLALVVENGLSDIAVLYADDAFSKDSADGTKKWAERFRLKIVLFEGFRKGARNLDEHAKKAMASKAQVVIVCGHFDEAVDMRLSLKRVGWYPKAFFASVGPATDAFYERLGGDADHVFSSSQWEPFGASYTAICGPFCEEFMRAYKKPPSYFAAFAYAAGQILEAASEKSGSLDRREIREVLSKMDATSVVGRYGVDKTGMQVKHFNLIIQWQNGKKEIVWPKELRTAKPIFQ